jgi:hypothetical protein
MVSSIQVKVFEMDRHSEVSGEVTEGDVGDFGIGYASTLYFRAPSAVKSSVYSTPQEPTSNRRNSESTFQDVIVIW